MRTRVRLLTETDLDAAADIATAAYRSPFSRRPELGFYRALQPDGWFIAEHEGSPAGIVGIVSYGSFASVGMMAVAPPLQRRGIARALMEQVVEWLDSRSNLPAILEASESGAPLYPQYGFIDRGATSRYRATLPARDIGAPGSEIGQLTEREFPEVLALDLDAFGSDRGYVLRAYQVSGGANGFVARDLAGNVAGYVFERQGHVGPLVAKSQTAARSLLIRALHSQSAPECTALVPEENARAVGLIGQNGFARERSLRHMRRGELPHPIRRGDRLYGLASLALG